MPTKIKPAKANTAAIEIEAAVEKLRPHAHRNSIAFHRRQAGELRAEAGPFDDAMIEVADEHEAIADLLQALRPKRGR